MHFLCKKAIMTVLVFANESLLDELTAQPFDEDVELIPATGIEEELQSIRPDACIDLLFDNTAQRITSLKALHAGVTIINSVQQSPDSTPPEFIRLNGWPTMLQRSVAEITGGTDDSRDIAIRVFTGLGRKINWVPDISGMITPRIISGIINEAYFALGENISTEQEIDTAMKMGTNYPFGPFEWAQKIGIKRIYFLLAELAKQQQRYTPSSRLEITALA
jgi:3-hydroxybutyryl-CoA dehydrogenase